MSRIHITVVILLFSIILISLVMAYAMSSDARGEGEMQPLPGRRDLRVDPEQTADVASLMNEAQSEQSPADADEERISCTYPAVFWQSREEAWPAEFTIGERLVGRATAQALFSDPNPDARTFLLKNLYTALLNILWGVDPDFVKETVTVANQWLAENPSGETLSDFNRDIALDLAYELEEFNNGVYGPGLCSDAPPIPTPTSLFGIPSGLETPTPALLAGATETVTPQPAPTLRPFSPTSVADDPGRANTPTPFFPTLAPPTLRPTATRTPFPWFVPSPTVIQLPTRPPTETRIPPSATSIVIPTLAPTSTRTPRPAATATQPPPPTSTPRPTATNTEPPPPTATDTPVPPTETNTPEPPPPTATDTPVPPPIDTNTPEALIPPTEADTQLTPTDGWASLPPTPTVPAVP